MSAEPLMAKRRRTSLSYRRQAALVLGQLRHLSRVHAGRGEILDAEPWLKVLAATLSSVPPPTLEAHRRNPKAGQFCLTEDTLTRAAIECRVSFTRTQVASQVSDTLAWRKSEDSRAGKAIYRPMKPDTIGRLLGVTEETRRDAQAWLIGTYDGNPKERAQAYREREKQRLRELRAAKGARPHELSDAKLKPWESAGMSRSKWYRQKASGIETKTNAPNKGAEVETKTNATKTNAPNKGRETKTNAPNNLNIRCEQGDGSSYALPSNICDLPADRRERLLAPVQRYTLSDAIDADGLAAAALHQLHTTHPPRDYAADNARTIAQRAAKRTALTAGRCKGGAA